LYTGRGKGPAVDQARQARFDIRSSSAIPHELGPAGRLRAARRLAGYRSVTDAASAMGANRTTFSAHEAGQNLFPRDAAIRYARALGVEAEWLISGRPPSGLPDGAEAELPALIAMHGESDARALAAFAHLVRSSPPDFRLPEEEEREGGRSAPEPTPSEGDVVREYSARALFLKLSSKPGGLASATWTFPKDYLSQIYECSRDSAVLLVVPEGVPSSNCSSDVC
jgi:hypothetical protein